MTKTDELLELVLEYQKTKNIIILNKIIELNKITIDWYLKNTKLNISKDDLYNLIIRGLESSISNYNKDKSNNIISYISLTIRNFIYKNSIYIEEDKNRLFTSFLEYKEIIETKYGIKLEKDFSIFDDIIDLMIDDNIIKESSKDIKKKYLLQLLKDYYGSLKIINAPSSNTILNSNIEIPSDLNFLKLIINSTLNDQEYDYLISYYGLFGNNQTMLTELSKKYHVSKENISKIKNNAIEKLKIILEFYNQKPNWNININKLKELLPKILTKEELNCLLSFYGLFNNSKKTYKELESIYKLDSKKLSLIVDKAINKIFLYIEYQDINIPYTKIELENLLKRYLTKNEYKIFISFYVQEKSKEEYLKTHHITRDRLNDILLSINNKIKKLFIQDYKLFNFLKTILTKEEFELLSLKYGLFDNNKITFKEIASKYNMNLRLVNQIINMALEKIKIKFKYLNINIDKNLTKEIFQSLLTSEEYISLCQTYGIFGYQVLDRNNINGTCQKLGCCNIKSFTKVATLLNIESNKNNKL